MPDSTYDMVGGLDQQIKEIKEVGGCSGRGNTKARCMPLSAPRCCPAMWKVCEAFRLPFLCHALRCTCVPTCALAYLPACTR